MRQEKEKRFMKAKTLKKGLGIALSMAMTMSLFGCGSGDSAKEQASDTSETTRLQRIQTQKILTRIKAERI